ncbi:MAG: methylmalonyl Co-A mutase-associated GTPase MeaB [Verrucomicrobiota bacterium JB024]|nr:methylmalonyl Co-A mutase-associated GTPase MeaB [Verrucomicrobiota bacterium JB024]
MAEEKQRPEWVPAGADGQIYTTEVMKGVTGGHDGMPGQTVHNTQMRTPIKKRRVLTAEDYIEGIRQKNRTILARAITLIESNAPAHQEIAQEVLNALIPEAGNAARIGITGVPGVGKSTFIEAFGMMLCEQGKKVAVLAVDPSSTISGGSVLGDKTRMELLSRNPDAFIRPSPSGGTLGGVARKSRETMVLCEAAGFDVILVETVGVGQSEVTVRSMVDFFLLLMLSGQGDELQGIKKGVVELSDAIFVNKADGSNIDRAKAKRSELHSVLRFLQPHTEGWKPTAGICSAETGFGIDEVWATIERFYACTRESGFFDKRRQRQQIEWMHALIEEGLKSRFFRDPVIKERLPQMEAEIRAGQTSVAASVEDLLRRYFQKG